jgi:ribonuclease P protein component
VVTVRAGTAVERNRIKRRLRAAFAAAAIEGCDVVAQAERPVGGLEFDELINTMRTSARRARGEQR